MPAAMVARTALDLRAVCNRTVEIALQATSPQRGYVLIAAISGPGPMMLMTRVRL
jgi:hypothetical protein